MRASGMSSRAGLVEARRDGTRMYYRITDVYILRICDAVCDSLVVFQSAFTDACPAMAIFRKLGLRPCVKATEPAAR